MLTRLTSRRAAWAAVALASLSTFVALATAGRLPGVDLPAHAVTLRHILDTEAPGYDGPYQVLPTAAYTAFFALARAFAFFVDPERAVLLATSLSVALLPVSAAAAACSLRRSPALGVFALAGAFSSSLGWGLASFVLGANAVALCVAAAVAWARRSTAPRGVALALALCFAYTAHSAAWAVALPSALFLCAARGRRSPRTFLPVIAAGVVTVAALARWRSRPDTPFHLLRLQDGPRFGPAFFARVAELPSHLAGFGAGHALPVACAVLVALLAARLIVPLARPRRRRRRPGRARVTFARAAPALVAAGCALAYFATPLDYTAFFLYPRFVVLFAVLLPACLPRARGAARVLPMVALVPALALAAAAHEEGRAFSESTRCIDELAAAARPGEALVPLSWVRGMRGYTQPVTLHLADVIVARRGGSLPFDFVDMGANVVGYRDGFVRDIPHWDDSHPEQYVHAAYGGEFTAWLVAQPPKGIASIFGAQQGWTVDTCGPFSLVTDGSVPPGSRPAVRFLPHRRTRPP